MTPNEVIKKMLTAWVEKDMEAAAAVHEKWLLDQVCRPVESHEWSEAVNCNPYSGAEVAYRLLKNRRAEIENPKPVERVTCKQNFDTNLWEVRLDTVLHYAEKDYIRASTLYKGLLYDIEKEAKN